MTAFAERALAKDTTELEIAAAWPHEDSQAAKQKSADARGIRSRPGQWSWKPAGTTFIMRRLRAFAEKIATILGKSTADKMHWS
jgi:hypothetical protein